MAPSSPPSESPNTKKRGRPATSEQERKELLMEKALQLFLSKGHFNTRIEDIALLAKVSKTSFYSCFQDKESLIRELMENFFKELRRPFYETVVQIHGRIQLRDLIQEKSMETAEILMRNRSISLFILQQGETLGPELRVLIHKFNNNLAIITQKLLQKAIKKKLLLPFNTHIAALCMLGSMERVYEEWLKGKIPYPPHDVVNEIISLFF